MRPQWHQFGQVAWGALMERWPTLGTFARAEDGPKILQGSLDAFYSKMGKVEAITEGHEQIPPVLGDVEGYFQEIKLEASPIEFMAFYDLREWKVAGRRMKSWKKAALYWKARAQSKGWGRSSGKRASFA